MLLDDFLPVQHFREHHQALAAAPAARLFQATLDLDMRRSHLVGALLHLRELPWRLHQRDFKSQGLGRSLDEMQAFGFIKLAQDSPRELVLGLVGCFWSLNPDVQRLTPEQFRNFARPGYAKVAANFAVEPLGRGLSRLTTETRVLCLGDEAKAKFRRYWTIIRPFSGLIRREWLRMARQQAENQAGPGQQPPLDC